MFQNADSNHPLNRIFVCVVSFSKTNYNPAVQNLLFILFNSQCQCIINILIFIENNPLY
jgi:hypothetical protein